MKVFYLLLVMISASAGATSHSAAAESYLVADFETGYIFAAKHEDTPRQVASLTKIAAVVVILEWLKEKGGDPAQLLAVSAEAFRGGGNPLKLEIGDMLPLDVGIYAAMMASDNTSTAAMAAAMGRQMQPGSSVSESVEVFVVQMNALAKRLGMVHTRFVNPHGLDGENTQGVSTAADMARLVIHAYSHPEFSKFSREKKHDVAFLRNGKSISKTLTNTNELLGSHGIEGTKTGTTRRAGACLIVSAVKEIKGKEMQESRRLIAVVLKSEDRFRETVLLLNEAWPACEKWRADGGGIGTNDYLRKEVK